MKNAFPARRFITHIIIAALLIAISCPAFSQRKRRKADANDSTSTLTNVRRTHREAKTLVSLDPTRVVEIAQMIPERPTSMLPPITDRPAWTQLAGIPAGAAIITAANEHMNKPIAEQPDDLFLEFSRNGNRSNWQDVAMARRAPLDYLVIAECLENKGRFLPAIEKRVNVLCDEKTWVLPAHDAQLTNFNGTRITIDLWSSALGWRMAQTDHLLGDKLQPATRQKLRAATDKFVVIPFSDMVAGRRLPDWWFELTNNWNSVCFAGALGTTLLQVPDKNQRAAAIAATEKYSNFFLSSFTPDGYCSEGLGYWNYGYGHFAIVSELIRHATSGKIDLMTSEGAKMPALFGARIQTINGVSPAFADCSINASPAPELMWMVNRRFGLQMPAYANLNMDAVFNNLLYLAPYYNALRTPPPVISSPVSLQTEKIRTWFDKAGVMIGRPLDPAGLSVALKGGNNAEHHNHNDLGTFVVVKGNKPVLLDPGTESYTARTFSKQRYDSKLLNSYGHPVPVIAGQLQLAGKEAVAQVVKTEFTDTRDLITYDLKSAYAVPALKKLERTFEYSRSGHGALAVTDVVEFSEPQTYETALITLGKAQQQGPNKILFTDETQALSVTIDTGGTAYVLGSEEIKENAAVKPTRVAVRLSAPVTSARVRLLIEPGRL